MMKKKAMHKFLLFLFFMFSFGLFSCNDYTPIPKPRGYFQVVLPQKGYQEFNKENFPFVFRFPTYGVLEKDTNLFANKENPYWININFPSLSGKIFLSYKKISTAQPLQKLITDAYELSSVHDKKASYRYEDLIHTKNNVHGLFFSVGGNAASAYQFLLTDSVNHFLRGALYFAATPNADSLKPVTDFIRQDLDTLIQTLKWVQ